MKQRDCYVCDIDGTIADISHRLHFIKGAHLNGGAKPDWDAFNDASAHDVPIQSVIETIRALSERCPIVLATGRSEEWRKETEEWLRQHDVPFSELYMRPAGDHRPDTEIKREIYEEHLKDRNVIGVFDDRDRVVEMWRGLGLRCFQVAPGAY